MIRKLLPYRVRTKWDNFRVERALRGIASSKPVHSAEVNKSEAELHMLICHRDVLPSILSIKSLLRFSDVNISIAITDDGSLTSDDKQLIDQHLLGCRWLIRGDEQVRAALSDRGYSELLKLYDSDFKLSAKLVHPLLANQHENIIVLDPDTAFFGRPRQLIEWTKSPSTCLYTRDNNDQRDTQLDPRVSDAFEDFARNLQAPSWKIGHYYYNSGLLAFVHSACDLNIAEQFLVWKEANQSKLDFESSSIWFGPWTREQVGYLVMFAAMDPPAESFGDEYRLGSVGKIFSHFMRANMVRPDVLKELSRLCHELPR